MMNERIKNSFREIKNYFQRNKYPKEFLKWFGTHSKACIFFALLIILIITAFGYRLNSHGQNKRQLAFVKRFHAPCLSGPPQLRCISIGQILHEVRNGKISRDAYVMGGISVIESVIVDDNKDILLIGQYHPDREPMYLDDFVAMIRNTWLSNVDIHCSLDPKDKNIKRLNRFLKKNTMSLENTRDFEKYIEELKEITGPQLVRIGGVENSVRTASTMIYADYHMKKVSQSLLKIDGIPSSINIRSEETTNATGEKTDIDSSSMSRFWFHLQKDEPHISYSDGIISIESCKIGILTEKQKVTSKGKLEDSFEDDANAELFAEIFTNRFHEISDQVVWYQDLVNLYRMLAIIKAMKIQNMFEENNYDLRPFLYDYRYRFKIKLPKSLPGLANGKRITANSQDEIVGYVVCGGVSMETIISKTQFASKPNLILYRKKTILSKPVEKKLWWAIENI
ncbi:MAG TPA: DUF1598 domain-containing protein [Anaerohalosphaeraceae bacterium]|nr:DUF1598 domain-containing protein [Anaerohalosphaeraceae bacterium]